jgi:protein-arginine kinase
MYNKNQINNIKTIKMNKEFKRMQKLAGILKENQQINSLQELSNYLTSIVNEYVGETEMVAGDKLDWDNNGTTGISEKELVEDFIGYLQDMYL